MNNKPSKQKFKIGIYVKPNKLKLSINNILKIKKKYKLINLNNKNISVINKF